jgi:hypothetical protein
VRSYIQNLFIEQAFIAPGDCSVNHLLVLIIKANEMHYVSNLFDKVLCMFRTGPLSIIRTANRTSMTNTYCVYTVLRYSWWWTVDLSETCTVLYEINLRNSAYRWLLLEEYITMHSPLNAKFTYWFFRTHARKAYIFNAIKLL